MWGTYIVVLASFLNLGTIFMFWMAMEVNMVTFILIMLTQGPSKEMHKSSAAMFYFIIQTIGSILFLISASSNMTDANMSKILLLIALALKMGIFPFHTWMFSLSKGLDKFSFWLILTTQKLSGVMIIAMLPMPLSGVIIYTSGLFGPLFILKSSSTKELLISSSIYFTIWLWIMTNVSMFYFGFMFMFYTFMTMIIINTDEEIKKGEKSNNLKWFSSVMFLTGLPPIGMFFLKTYTMNFIMNFMSQADILLIWTAAFIATMGYLKMFMPSIVESKKINNKVTMKGSGLYAIITLSMILIMIL